MGTLIETGGCAPPVLAAATITDKDRALWDRLRDLIVHGSETDVLLALAEHREGGPH